MSHPSRLATYAFAGVTFARRLEADEFPPWFNADPQYTKDIVLGGALAYVDFGADVYPPLVFRRAWCLTSADRATLIAALKTTGTLANSHGQSVSATLVSAVPLRGGSYRYFWIDLTFEYRP